MEESLNAALARDRRELFGGDDAREESRIELHDMLVHEAAYSTVRRWLDALGTFAAVAPDVSAIALHNFGMSILMEISAAHPQVYLRLCADAAKKFNPIDEENT